jgi:4-hydroxy-tetrahydrodipicolinate synthase
MSMDTMEAIAGCGTALVTPFQPNGSLDEAALRSLVEWQIGEGIGFLVPCGSTGESPALDHEEYLRVVGITVDVTDRRVPVVAGAGGNNTAKVMALIRDAERLGADGILSVSPYYNRPTQEGIFEHFRAIAGCTKLPIIVYNVPGRTGSNILPDTILKMAEIPNILGVKEASGDISQIGEICTRAPAGFHVFSGDDALTLPVMALGGRGVISVASNEIPKMMSNFANSCLCGRWDVAREWNRRLYPLMRANFLETNPIPVKAALAMMGRISEGCRLPLVKLSDAARGKLAAILSSLDLLPPETGKSI